MNDNTNYSDLLQALLTKEQADHFVSQVSLLNNSLYKTKSNLDDLMSYILTPEQKQIIETTIVKNSISKDDNIALQEFLLGMMTFLQRLPVVHLSLAFNPSVHLLSELMEWIQQRINQPVLFQIKVDSALIGGAIVEFNGKHKNVSVAKYLQELVS